MRTNEHARLIGGALKNWFVAQVQDSLAVAALWLVGLWIIGVPWAPLWAFLGGALQFIPHLGPAMSLIGPAIAALASAGFMRLIYVFILYAIIVVVDGLVLQPFLMKRTARVPIWASVLTPIVLALLLPSFWGVVIAAPLLAILFAYRARRRQRTPPPVEIIPPPPRGMVR